MIHSRFFRIYFSYFLIILALSIIFSVYIHNQIREDYMENSIKNLKNISLSLQQLISPLIGEDRWQEIDLLINCLYSSDELRVSLIRPDGSVIADSFKSFQEMESHQNRPEIRDALSGQESHIIRYSSTAREEMLFTTYPVIVNDQIPVVLRLGIFLDELNSLMNKMRNTILLITGFMMILAFAIAWYIEKNTRKPLPQFIEAMNRVSLGDYDTRIVPKKGEIEFEEWMNGFNLMTEKIKENMTKLISETEELNRVISALPDGVVLLDEKGKIILSNENFNLFVSTSRVIEKFYWEVIRESHLTEKIRLLMENKENFTTEIEMAEKYFLFNGTYIHKKSQYILVFQDITRTRRLDQEKRELIANLSHELRTPLTSIKGYLETINDADEENRRRFLQIISRNTDRLIHMVNDLLSLSRLETGIREMIREPVHFGILMADVARIFEPALEEKGLAMKLDVDPELPPVKADPFQMEQLLMNLIDNAIHYTDQGEIRISIRKEQGDNILIRVEDTGIGIKKEDLTRIFERFYVASKARSRQEGGTGLGLSIVKHIVLLHEGEIKVDSQPGIGTQMTVILPVNQT